MTLKMLKGVFRNQQVLSEPLDVPGAPATCYIGDQTVLMTSDKGLVAELKSQAITLSMAPLAPPSITARRMAEALNRLLESAAADAINEAISATAPSAAIPEAPAEQEIDPTGIVAAPLGHAEVMEAIPEAAPPEPIVKAATHPFEFRDGWTVAAWLDEEAAEIQIACKQGDKAMVLDGIYDALGILLSALCMCDPAEARTAHEAYVASQVERKRQVNGVPHHDIITGVVEGLSNLTQAEVDHAAAVLRGKAKRIAGRITGNETHDRRSTDTPT